MTRFSAALAVLLLGAASTLQADTITRAQITVNAANAADLLVTNRLTVRVDSPRKSIDLYLSDAVEITKAESDGRGVGFSPTDVPGTLLRRWTIALSAEIPSGETGVVSLEAKVSPAPGIRAAADGGYLLPGSGWFPRVAPETDELPVHSTTFELPAGRTGVAAGDGSGSGPWTTDVGTRPFAAWGTFEQTRIASAPGISAWRRKGRTGEVPGVERLALLAEALATGMHVTAAAPAWQLIDVGHGVVAGGRGVVFWDEEVAAGADGAAAQLLERDLAGAMAATLWTEDIRMVGSHAAWLSRSIAAYLGDVASIALDESDQREGTEALIIGSRRDALLEGLAGDRSLAGLVPASADGPRVLATRGALLAHMLAEAVPSRTVWLVALAEFRRTHAGATVDLATFREVLRRTFATHHEMIWPLFETADLPDFRISGHGPAKGLRRERYRVEVENRGKVAGPVEVVTLSAEGHRLRGTRLMIPPNEKKSIAFDRVDQIARIVLDPRGVSLQSETSGEVVELKPVRASTPFVPSFAFYTESHTGQKVEDFHLDLESVSISGFDGYLAYYSTHHGPSGAALVGTGDVTIRPTGEFEAGFTNAMGKNSLTFYGAKNMWVRFPLSEWKKIEPQLGEEGSKNERAIFKQRNRIHQHMFDSYFSDEKRAQVPPPGSSMLLFIAEANEWRGIVRRPLQNGRVEMRLWDHLRRETIWEETH